MPGAIHSLLILAALALAPATGWSAAPADAALTGKATALRQSADQGDANAALQLGNLLNQGRISIVRFGTAADWYKKACTLGSTAACHNAAVAYEYGKNGVARNYAEAANYYLKAAEQAFLPSQFNLAALHANAHVTSLDSREGLKWLLIAQKSAASCAGAPLCKYILDDPSGHRSRLEAQLSARERLEARQLAEDWRPEK